MYTKSFFFWGAGYRPPPDTPRAGGYGLGPWPRAHTPPFHVFTHPHKSFSLSHKIFTPNPTMRQSKHEKNTPTPSQTQASTTKTPQTCLPRPPPPHQASPPHEMRPNGRISGGAGGPAPPRPPKCAHSGAFHEVVRLGVSCLAWFFVGLGEGFLFFMKHAPLSPWERGRG